MTAPKRTKLQRERDLAEIARRYLQGEIQASIGQSLGISQQQISKDLKTIQQRWQQSAIASLDERKARELAKVDLLEVTYWEAWNRSLEEHQISSTRKRDTGEGGMVEASVRREQGEGNPRFLEGVQWCIERRCRILGLDAPEKRDLTSGGRALRIVELVAGDQAEADAE